MKKIISLLTKIFPRQILIKFSYLFKIWIRIIKIHLQRYMFLAFFQKTFRECYSNCTTYRYIAATV